MKVINHIKANYLLYAILALAAFLRFYKADFQSLWVDEILTMNDSDPSHTFRQLYNDVLFWEQMPHLYFIMVKIVFSVFGFTSLVGRIFSGVFGVFGVYAIYLLGKAMYDKKAGLIAALFLSVNYFHIFYSQEIRPYGMLFLFTTLSFYRLVFLLKNPSMRNAIYYGIFTGLVINSHLFGMITILAQCILLLFYLIKTPKEQQKSFFMNCLVAGGIILLFAAPGYEAILQVIEKKSFWLGPPTPTIYTDMFREFYGGSEMVLFAINLMFLFYILSVFRQKEKKDGIINNRLIFSAIIFSIWLLVSLLIPLLKSYLDLPMIIYRYFIGILTIAILIPAIATRLIRNKTASILIVAYITVFSFVDLTVVRKYYSTPTKSQSRELSAEIIKRNPENAKVVAFWTWLFSHYIHSDSGTAIDPVSQSLEEYVNKLKSGAEKEKGFWYADMNSRPFTLSDQNQQYLNEKFILREQLDYVDAWARYYVPKNPPAAESSDNFGLSMFGPVDNEGKMTLYNNAVLKSDFISLPKGKYMLVIQGQSLPAKPIKGENAHIKVRMNGDDIGNFFLSEKGSGNKIEIVCEQDKKARFQIIYDNDDVENGRDRNAVLQSVQLKRR